MPLYIVSWSDGECMVIRCRDEDDLIYRLDQFGDPAEATWKVYNGPFVVSLRPQVDRAEDPPFITYSAELNGDEAGELSEAMTKFAFPRTYEAERQAWDQHEDAGLELLLHAEIASKGQSERSAEKLGEWIRRTYLKQLQHLPEEERHRRIEMLSQAMGWTIPPKPNNDDVG